MSLRKCPQCGLVAFSQDVACRRCGADLAAEVQGGPAADLKPTAIDPSNPKKAFLRDLFAD